MQASAEKLFILTQAHYSTKAHIAQAFRMNGMPKGQDGNVKVSQMNSEIN